MSFSFSCVDDFKDTIENEENKINTNPDPLTNWEKMNTAVSAAAGAAMVYYDNWIYIYGGEDFFGANDNFFRYNIINGNIEILNSDDARAYATLVEYNGELYLFGGKDENDDASDELKRYNITTNTWYTFGPSDTTSTSSVPEARYSHIAVVYNNSIYIQGGRNTKGVVASNLYRLYFDPDPSKKPDWSNQTLTFERYAHTAAVIKGEIYFFGGFDGTEHKNDLWKYTLLNSSISAIQPFTEIKQKNNILPRSAMQMAAINNKLYIYGGKNKSTSLNDVQVFSLNDSSWKNLGNGPALRSDYGLAIYNNSIYYYGGSYIDNSNKTIYYSELWQYTP